MNCEFHPSLQDLLSECFDAVIHCPWDDDNRIDHLFFLNMFISRRNLDENTYALLNNIIKNLSTKTRFFISNDEQKENDILAKQIHSRMSDLNFEKYVYHGTIFGRIKDILNKGLLPGENPVWKEPLVSRQHCNDAVFFSLTWRNAMSWAESAHHRSRGPREGNFRRPVVLRIPMTGLNLEHDPLSMRSGSYMVRSSVPLKDPHVIIGRQGGFPIWRPLAEVVSK